MIRVGPLTLAVLGAGTANLGAQLGALKSAIDQQNEAPKLSKPKVVRMVKLHRNSLRDKYGIQRLEQAKAQSETLSEGKGRPEEQTTTQATSKT